MQDPDTTASEAIEAPHSRSDATAPNGDAASAGALKALDAVVACIEGGVERAGQREMAAAVADAIANRRHLLVEAGTGTGKSLAYLVPAILSGRRVVVVTATRALQEQLCNKDLPQLEAHLDDAFSFALLKGRSNYLCLARKAELDEQRQLAFDGSRRDEQLLDEIDAWVADEVTGDRSDLPSAVPDRLWELLSVDSRECPGRARCDLGDGCFAELARDRAADADVVVVNSALYARDLESHGAVLPDHSVVVIDEAHGFEDIAADAFGEELGPGRLRHLAGAVGKLIVSDADRDPVGDLNDWAERSETLFAAMSDDAPVELDDATRASLTGLGEMLGTLSRSVAAIPADAGDVAGTRLRVAKLVDSARVDVASMLSATSGEDVLWVERRRSGSVLHSTSVDVGRELARELFARRTVILSSATLATGGSFDALAWRLGLRRAVQDEGRTSAESHDECDEAGERESDAPEDPTGYDGIRVQSPFDYRRQAVLYVAAHLPEPRRSGYEEAVLEEFVDLVRAAGGRTLGLCTSLRVADAVRSRLREELDVSVLGPDDLPRSRLLAEFAADETSCLVGSMSLWQGIDVPGPALSLVVIDKIPFSRPTDPYAVARRDHAAAMGHDPFDTFDVPRAAMLLAQGAGRLVRRSDDRGVVALLDPRLVTRRYGSVLAESLPPMFRMTDPQRVRAALGRLSRTEVNG